MKTLFVASECTPFAKVGGLGDVIGALPKALKKLDVDISVILPYYLPLIESSSQYSIIHVSDFVVPFYGKIERCSLWSTKFQNSDITLYLVRNDRYLSNGGIYLSPTAFAQGDEEPERYIFFSKAVSIILSDGVVCADIVHCHDYHTSLLTKLVKDLPNSRRVKTVLSIHNLANQGEIASQKLNMQIDGSPASHNLLQVGIENADLIIPVSKRYAAEILTGEFGEGLEGVLNRYTNKIHGITNGLDIEYFDPSNDSFLTYKYSVTNWREGKKAAKEQLYTELGWRDTDGFLCGVVSRLTHQKNIDLIAHAIDQIHQSDIHFIIEGVGDEELVQELNDTAAHHGKNLKFFNVFDERIARLVYAGSDAFLVPSLFEPCGLTQLIAMRYGAIPIARKVGGLAETIEHGADGFLFQNNDIRDFVSLIEHAYVLWKKDHSKWEEMVERAMRKDLSWDRSAEEYVQCYQQILNVSN